MATAIAVISANGANRANESFAAVLKALNITKTFSHGAEEDFSGSCSFLRAFPREQFK